MTARLKALLLLTFALWGGAAGAHEMSMAEMQARETAPGEFIWQWTPAERGSPGAELTPVWPDGCQSEANVVRCGAGGLLGTFEVEGVGKRYSAAMVKVVWLDGQTRVYTLTSGQPRIQLYGSADDKRGAVEIAKAYTYLGIEHILTGYDHLAFVIALLFLVGFHRRLIGTITAFTLAHSLTLALSALGWLALRSPPVEATIALSIVLVAGEGLHLRPTLSRRWPALVAFLFGLVHGLGFAGALKEFGLPDNHLSIALLGFNVGVELGQLAFVAVAFLLTSAVSCWPVAARVRTPALYGIGSLAAYWAWVRVVGIAL